MLSMHVHSGAPRWEEQLPRASRLGVVPNANGILSTLSCRMQDAKGIRAPPFPLSLNPVLHVANAERRLLLQT